MNKIKKALYSIMTILLVNSAIVGCNKGNGNSGDISFDSSGNIINTGKAVEVNFWGWGDKEEVEVFTKIVNTFNQKYEGKIKVNYVQRPSGSYAETLLVQLNGKKGPDVYYVQDKFIKQFSSLGYCLDLTDFVANSKYDTKLDESDLFSNILSRYRYDKVTTTSNIDDPLWAVPKDLAPTAIFYNKTHFKTAGITCISIPEEEMKKNNDVIKAYFYDEQGKFTSNGFPGYVFNNKIAMNWAECIELSNRLMEFNPDKYGFFSEWWFNYGWSVGGNCVEYVETNDPNYNEGRYKFTLNDPTKNYIVKDSVESVIVSGKTYKAGETISYQDKIADKNVFDGNDNPAINPEITALINQGKLDELPSQREAFTEFVRLSQKSTVTVDNVKNVYSDVSKFYGADSNGDIKGYSITPNPTTIEADGKTGYFTSGKVSMLVNTMSSVKQVRANMKDEWDVCPVLQYKEYSKDGKTVLVKGKQAAHSGSVGIAVNAKTQVKEAAYCFAEFIASAEGQSIQASEGWAIPIQKSVANSEVFLNSASAPENIEVFIDACEYQTAGDWWLLSDSRWIDDWANLLNGDVRNGKMLLSDFYKSDVYLATQGKLDEFTKK
jgi:ABC-type glycerol-3-phosphate transport system substrate-binding protein